MIQATTKEGILFRKLIESIKQLVKSVNLDFSPNGMSLQAMDSSHVALVTLMLKQNSFFQIPYRCDTPTTIGISIQNLLNILKCATSQDLIKIYIEQKDPSFIKFQFESNYRQREFALNLQNIQSDAVGIPQTQFSSIVQMPSDQFATICKQFLVFSKSIEIQTSKGHIKFGYSGNTGNGNTILNANDDQSHAVTLDVKQPVKLLFGAKYLTQFSKASSISKRVRLYMTPETPLLVEYELPKEMGQLKYYLAPKVDNSE